MSFLSFLKAAEAKVAVIFKEAAKLEPEAVIIADVGVTAAGFPEFMPFIAKVGNILVAAGGAVTAVQGSAATGVSKLAVAAPLVEQAIQQSGFFGDKVIADSAKWSAAVQTMTGALADMLDSVTAVPVATVA
jgi:hypothetical protein